MRPHAAGRPWVFALDPGHPAIRETLAEGGRATTVVDGAITVLDGYGVDRLVPLLDVPSTLAGISRVYIANALAATSAALAIGLPRAAVVRGLRTFVLDPAGNPGRANLFALHRRTVVIDYAHNAAGIRGLVEIMRGLAMPGGGQTWVAICTAGDRTDEILRDFAFEAAVGADHMGIADLPHYARGRATREIYEQLARAAAEAGVGEPPRYRGELQALRTMLAASRPGDVVAVTALGMRPQIFRWLESGGARPLTPADVRRRARAAAGR
jgi:cyanophycin synthetase